MMCPCNRRMGILGLVGLLILGLGWTGGSLLSAPVAQTDELTLDEPPLAEPMARFGRAFRRLRRQASVADKVESSLDLVLGMQAACLDSKTMEPSAVAQIGDGEKEAFIKNFRIQMIDLMTALLELEKNLLNGDMEAAAASFEKVHATEESGHARFRDLE